MTEHIALTGPIENRTTSLRTHLCGVLRPADEGAEVTVCGWVARRREHGEHLAFIDLRDHSGVIQCVIDNKVDVRSEWVVAISGTVRRRPPGMENAGIETGEVEVGDCTVVVLNEAEPPPFSVDERDESDEQVRLRYRYVDLRRPRLQRNLRLRARVNAAIRAAMDRQGFCEVETPLLWAPTPEGSREFSVPSRLHHGSFYVLPQSPQLAKQLLMVGGFDRYYQIARCLRDEDLRADRQFEFTQLDMEASFAGQDDVMGYVSEAVLDAAEAATGERPPPISKMTWADALDRFGTDKPDLRFGMELVDLTAEFAGTEVRAFAGSHLKAMRVPEGAALSRVASRRADRAGEAGSGRADWPGSGSTAGGESGAGGGSLALDSPLDRACRRPSGRPSWRRPVRRRGTSSWPSPTRTGSPAPRSGTLRPRSGRPPVGEGPHRYVWVTDFPMFDGVDGEGNPLAGPPPLHHALPRGPRPPRHGPVRRALPGLRPGPQRVGAGLGQRPYPPRATSSRGSSTRWASATRRRRPGSASCSAPSATAPRRTPASPSASTVWRPCWPARRTSAR